MAGRILTRGEITVWYTVAWILGPIAAVVGIVIVACQQPAGWIVLAAGVLITTLVAVATMLARMQQQWVEDLGSGFVVSDRQGTREYRDEQITSLAHKTEARQSGGEVNALIRTFTLWLENTPQPLIMTNTIRTGHSDPLQHLIDRLVAGLAQRFEGEIERGGSAAGEGWRLDRSYLLVGLPPNEEPVPLAAIAAVDLFEEKVCVWRSGRDDAFLKVPIGSRNMHLLPILLRPRITQSDEGKDAASTTGLGRILFERKPSVAFQVILLLLCAAALVVGGVLFVTNQGKLDGIMFLGIAIGLAILFAVGAICLRFMLFRCHQNGVFKATILGEKILLYQHVAAFTYSATRHYHNGAYTGTQLMMRFDPIAGCGSPAISYSANVQVTDDDLDTVRDFISNALAERMAEQLSTGQPVPWTPNLTFFREGVQYRAAGLIGRKEPQLLPYEMYGGYNLNQGSFFLFAKGNAKPVVSEACSAKNFFPGFYMLLMMLERRE